jgi:hypothetical protein
MKKQSKDHSAEQIKRTVIYLFQYGFAKSLQDSVKARLADGVLRPGPSSSAGRKRR